ncbi:hypothetical protein DAEQUDRAFT_104169 [Daedalea quercina L-15889]|uniref:Uncharacterized protein n=1 Tax=Daedalea quercina L-15889 TaxID=1314783 RepID=A0A165KV23_9APHY|nr:hypothetical protein DAEQUDRAFT_104169 [Daedalea quercina L-15889]
MASTLTTESRSGLRERRPVVPLLLSSFPLPPSHIPSNSSPLASSSSNLSTSTVSAPTYPPPSLPPSGPLPPVPGPSPVSQHETLMLITAARSRRTSKLSLNSTSSYSRRSSTASSASMSTSLPSLSPSASLTPGDSTSTRSLRSYPSNGSLAAPTSWRGTMASGDKSPVFESSICEEDPADLTRMSLDEIRDPELSDDDKGLARIGASALKERSHRGHRHHSANDSISSIDMRDLPPLNEKEDEVAIPVPKMIPSPKKKKLHKELPPLPIERGGAASPDIDQILAKTPRPRRKSSGCPSRSVSRTRARSLRRHVSDGTTLSSSSRRTTEGMRGRPSLPVRLGSEEPAEDSLVEGYYGSPIDATGTPLDVVSVGEEERMDRMLEGEGSDSDSDIDIHTPLPNLMLRDGLLSPNSKLLPQAQAADDRPSSHMSVVSNAGSVMTKSGLFKDERDTVRRRVRHRDGRLLQGGIGLTTGLGWSDSEDEDAPSPLTRKLSTSTLSRKSLPSTLRSSTSTSSSLSRHFKEMGQEEERRPRASLPSDLSRKPSVSSVSMPRSSLSSMRSMPSSSKLSTARSHTEEMPKSPRSAPANGSVSRISGFPAVRRPERSFSDADAIYNSNPALQRLSSASSRAGSLRITPSQSRSSTSPGHGPGTPTRSTAPPTAWAGGRTPEVPRPLRLPQGYSMAGSDSSRRRSDATDTSRLSIVSTGSNVSVGGGSVRGRQPTQVPQPAQRGRASSRASSIGPDAKTHADTGMAYRTTPSRAPSIGPDARAKPRTDVGMVYRTTPSRAPSIGPDTRAKPRTDTGMVYRTTPSRAPSIGPDTNVKPRTGAAGTVHRTTPPRAPSVGPDARARSRSDISVAHRTTPSSGTTSRPTMMRAPSSTRLRTAYQNEVGIAS